MKIQCEIIRDILPLYAEDMVSQPTRNMVEEHLGECESCTRELDALKNQEKTLPVPQIESLKRISCIIHNSRCLTAAAAVLFLLSFGLWLYGFMKVPVYLSQEEAVKDVYTADNGVLVIDYYDYVRGSCGIAQPGYTMAHICHTTRWDMLAHKNGWLERVWDRKLVGGSILGESENGNGVIISAEENSPTEELVDTGTEKSWWYIDYRTGKADTLLWDAGGEKPEGRMVVAMYHMGWIGLIVAALGILGQIAGNYVKKQKIRLTLWYAGTLGNCYGFSTFILLGRNTICYNDCFETLNYIGGLTVLFWILVIVLRKLRQLDKI